VLARIRAVADSRAVVEAYGSSVYAPAYAQDVDVLVSGDDPARLASALALEVIPTTPPRLYGTLEGAEVDITIVNGDDEVARRMRSGPRDAAFIAAQLHDHGRDEVFQAAWPHVRELVRKRALGNNGLGWFGSFGWALLLAIPLVTELSAVTAGATIPAWLRWLARLSLGARIGFDGIRIGGGSDPEPFFLVAPTPPLRDVARLSKRTAATLFSEARAATLAIGDATTDADAIARIADLANDPPPGTTLVIAGDDEHGRGRYDGTARGLLRELDALCAARSWGRFDTLPDDDSWQHRITVPTPRAAAARVLVDDWLALMNINASVNP
jgi:hypothetical protein